MADAGPPSTPDETARAGRSARDLVRNPRLSATALVAVAALVGLVTWLVVESVAGDGDGGIATTQTSEPVALSANGLATLVEAGGQPIYWVGPRQGSMYELSRRDGQVFVRYLPRGVGAGDSQALLTVATYAVPDAFRITSQANPGTDVVRLSGGGVAALSESSPTSAYVAFPGVEYQIEIYDPDPAVVRDLATSGAVQPVPSAKTIEARGPEAVDEADLVTLSQELGHPIYWAGPRKGTTSELTVTADGSVFVRYLPSGTEVGAESPALTVATYPVADAYTVTRSSGSGSDSVVIDLPDGGVAVHGKSNTRNVYVAYPGQDVQAEVYSPEPGVAPGVARRGKIVPVG